jgi:hypothetical protein
VTHSHEVSFDGLAEPVTVAFDQEAQTITTTVAGSTSTVFVGVLEPDAEPAVVEAEPITEEV